MDESDYHPTDLSYHGPAHIRGADTAELRRLARGAAPLQHHGHPHDDIADDHHPQIEVIALLDGMEHRGQSECEDDHTDHLHHGQRPVEPVVGGEGRGEPGEVDPGQHDREHRQDKGRHRFARMPRGHHLGEIRCRGTDGNHEGQIEQQFQRRGDTALFIGVTADHPDEAMRRPVRCGGCGVAHVLHDAADVPMRRCSFPRGGR